MDEGIRPSKIVSTFGPGSIINLNRGRSAIVMSPDYWHRYDIIIERRLAKLLNVNHFRTPKEGWITSENDGAQLSGVLIRNFPYYWYCPKCRKIQSSSRVYCKYCKLEGEEISLVPPRVIAACRNGHIEDFPWRKWINCNDKSHILELHRSEGESDMEVRCPSCMIEKQPTEENPHPGVRSFKGILGEKKWKCNGKRPWIGDDIADENCIMINPKDETQTTGSLHGMMRGGSNLYFPNIRSSILIPKLSWKIFQEIITHEDFEYVKGTYDRYGEGTRLQEDIDSTINLNYRKVFLDVPNSEYTESDFQEAFMYYCRDFGSIDIKYDEWKAIIDPIIPSRELDRYDFHPEEIDIEHDEYLNQYFENIIILKRLTEVIAINGFYRIDPPTRGRSPTQLRENDDKKWNEILDNMSNGDGIEKEGYIGLKEIDEDNGRPIPMGKRDWLPAVKNRGEGIFFIFNQERLRRWEKDEFWTKWVSMINENGTRTLSLMDGFDLNNRGLLLHSFSHLISKQIAKECGYQLSSLRERLYCSINPEMYGVLIYTSTPDSQGSLGGLISQAQDKNLLKEHLMSTIEAARSCSQDPLCGISNPENKQNPWGAACHSCLHLPETSCESLMNKFLDRHSVSSNHPDKHGYFDTEWD